MNRKEVDIIILAYCKTEREYEMTCNCIKSIRKSEQTIDFNIIVVESNFNIAKERFVTAPLFNDRCKVILPQQKFNYNLFLQFGFEYLPKSTATHLVIANNDLHFYTGWATEMLRQKGIAQSFTPWCPKFHPRLKFKNSEQTYYHGYEVRRHLCGWCLMFDKKILDKVTFAELFPIEFDFWFQDDYYKEVIKHHKIKHALLKYSRVKHLVSKSHDLIPKANYHSMTNGARAKYEAMVRNLKLNS